MRLKALNAINLLWQYLHLTILEPTVSSLFIYLSLRSRFRHYLSAHLLCIISILCFCLARSQPGVLNSQRFDSSGKEKGLLKRLPLELSNIFPPAPGPSTIFSFELSCLFFRIYSNIALHVRGSLSFILIDCLRHSASHSTFALPQIILRSYALRTAPRCLINSTSTQIHLGFH